MTSSVTSLVTRDRLTSATAKLATTVVESGSPVRSARYPRTVPYIPAFFGTEIRGIATSGYKFIIVEQLLIMRTYSNRSSELI